MIVAMFVWFFIPETRDRTLEEIHEMFEAKVPPRKFKTYVCVGVEGYAAEVLAADFLKGANTDGKPEGVKVETSHEA